MVWATVIVCWHLCFPDLVNVFEVFLPQLLLYPNPSDPLNGEAAALMMRDRTAYEQRVKGIDHVQHSKFPIMHALKCQCLWLRSTNFLWLLQYLTPVFCFLIHFPTFLRCSNFNFIKYDSKYDFSSMVFSFEGRSVCLTPLLHIERFQYFGKFVFKWLQSEWDLLLKWPSCWAYLQWLKYRRFVGTVWLS